MLRRTKGFTLIELLVVIAIVAILAALLFPIFVRAKRAAKCSACLSNQHQLMNALFAYADDTPGGTFPDTSLASTRLLFPAYPSTTNSDISGELIYRLWPYTKNRRIYYCTEADVYYPRPPVYSYDYQSTVQTPRFQYIGYYYYASIGWAGTIIPQHGSGRRVILSCIGGGVGSVLTNEGKCGHERGRGIFTFADGHSKLINHFYYPYSGSECRLPDGSIDMNKVLLPRWPHE